MILEYIQIIIAGMFGAIFGSYSTLIAYRLPIGESCFGRYFGAKSHCPNCKKTLKTRELIPLINWVITRGKCSKCQFKIPKSHLFLELSIAILFMINFHIFGISDQFIIYSLISACLMILLVTDFKHRIFPDAILYTILLFSLAGRILQDQEIANSIFSMTFGCIFAAIFYKIFFEDGKSSLITKKDQALSYAKLIIITSICLPFISYILYISCILFILSIFILTGKFSSKKSPRIGICLIIPFIWILFYSPLNY